MIIVRTNDHFQAGAREVCEQGVKRDDDTKLMCPYPPFLPSLRHTILSLALSCHTMPCHAMCVVHCMTMAMLVGKLQETPQQQQIILLD